MLQNPVTTETFSVRGGLIHHVEAAPFVSGTLEKFKVQSAKLESWKVQSACTLTLHFAL